jgi:hypothetical protein
MGWYLASRATESPPAGPELAITETSAPSAPTPPASPQSAVPERPVADQAPVKEQPPAQGQARGPSQVTEQNRSGQQTAEEKQPGQQMPEEDPPLPLPQLLTEAQPDAPRQPGAAKALAEQPVPKGLPPSATFMGIRALGKRICIIADCSGSMAFNNRMTRLKLEMRKTLRDLKPDQEFYVIYFSTNAIPMPAKTWRKGGTDVEKMLRWIGAQPADGGTEPMPAFQRAFRLDPRPDTIFFLTDGLIPKNTPQGVARLNGVGKNKIPIHTILFGGELAGVEERIVMERVLVNRRWTLVPRRVPVAKMEKDEGQLEQVSRDSGGSHRFVPDTGKASR